jgi:hypothetical protein
VSTVVRPARGNAPERRRIILAEALADAYAYRRPCFPSECAACMLETPGNRCPDHAADEERAGAYLELAASLGVVVEG